MIDARFGKMSIGKFSLSAAKHWMEENGKKCSYRAFQGLPLDLRNSAFGLCRQERKIPMPVKTMRLFPPGEMTQNHLRLPPLFFEPARISD